MSQSGGSIPLGLWWLGVCCVLVGFCAGSLEMVLVSSKAEATGVLGEWFCVGLNISKILGWVFVFSLSFDLVFNWVWFFSGFSLVLIVGLRVGFTGTCWFGFGFGFPRVSLTSSLWVCLVYNNFGGFMRFGFSLVGFSWCKVSGLGPLSAGLVSMVSSRLLVLVWSPLFLVVGDGWGKVWGFWF